MNVPLPELKNSIKPVSKQLTQQIVESTLKEMCSAVSQTLGPHGNTISLQTSTYIEPKITKDGVTVARAFTYHDERQLVSDLVNKALNQVDHVAGDGTTSTTVLISKLYEVASSALTASKVTLPQLREQLQGAVEEAIKLIDTIKLQATPELLQKVAFTASNDKKLGKMLFDAIQYSDFVQIEESMQDFEDKVVKTTGVQYDQGYISPYFAIGASPRLKLQQPIVVLSDGVVSRVEQIRGALERSFSERRPLLVIAADIQGDALNTLLLNSLQRVVQCAAVRGFGYGNIRKVNLNDLAVILGAKPVDTQIQAGGDNEPVRLFVADGSNIQNVYVDGKSTAFELTPPEASKKAELQHMINELKKELTRKDQQSYEADQLRTRIARLGQKSAKIILTGQNSSEKRDRAWDCLMTLRNAKRSGLVKGSGYSQLELATLLKKKIDSNSMGTCGTSVSTGEGKKQANAVCKTDYPIGCCLLSRALEQIIVQLASQFGLNGQYIIEKLRNEGTAFDAYTGKIVKNVDVYDSAESLKQQLQQAVEVILSLVSVGGIVQEVNK